MERHHRDNGVVVDSADRPAFQAG